MQSEQKRQPVSASKPRLLDQVREVLRSRHSSIRTEAAYVDWIKKHPNAAAPLGTLPGTSSITINDTRKKWAPLSGSNI